MQRSYAAGVGGTFLVGNNCSYYPLQKANPRGESHVLSGFDKIRKKYVMRQFHLKGFVNQYVLTEAAIDGRSLCGQRNRLRTCRQDAPARPTLLRIRMNLESYPSSRNQEKILCSTPRLISSGLQVVSRFPIVQMTPNDRERNVAVLMRYFRYDCPIAREREPMKVIAVVVSTVLSFAGVAMAATGQQLAFDHASIMVSPGAPERTALEQAGLQISPGVNRNEGQGTASIAVEFQNSYLELVWVDASVPVKPSLERAAQKFRNRMAWRTSGWCPFGIASRRTTDQELTLPFPTWSWTADWMPKGAEMVMLTPREDTRSPALYIEPRALTDQDKQAALAARFHHPLGVHRITSVRLVSPKTYQPIESLEYLQKEKIVGLRQGQEWLLELTFDDGKQKRSKDLRPALPLLLRY